MLLYCVVWRLISTEMFILGTNLLTCVLHLFFLLVSCFLFFDSVCCAEVFNFYVATCSNFFLYGLWLFFFAMLEVSIHDYATIHVYFLVMLLWLYFSHLECLEFIWGDDGIFFP